MASASKNNKLRLADRIRAMFKGRKKPSLQKHSQERQGWVVEEDLVGSSKSLPTASSLDNITVASCVRSDDLLPLDFDFSSPLPPFSTFSASSWRGPGCQNLCACLGSPGSDDCLPGDMIEWTDQLEIPGRVEGVDGLSSRVTPAGRRHSDMSVHVGPNGRVGPHLKIYSGNDAEFKELRLSSEELKEEHQVNKEDKFDRDENSLTTEVMVHSYNLQENNDEMPQEEEKKVSIERNSCKHKIDCTEVDTTVKWNNEKSTCMESHICSDEQRKYIKDSSGKIDCAGQAETKESSVKQDVKRGVELYKDEYVSITETEGISHTEEQLPGQMLIQGDNWNISSSAGLKLVLDIRVHDQSPAPNSDPSAASACEGNPAPASRSLTAVGEETADLVTLGVSPVTEDAACDSTSRERERGVNVQVIMSVPLQEGTCRASTTAGNNAERQAILEPHLTTDQQKENLTAGTDIDHEQLEGERVCPPEKCRTNLPRSEGVEVIEATGNEAKCREIIYRIDNQVLTIKISYLDAGQPAAMGHADQIDSSRGWLPDGPIGQQQLEELLKGDGEEYDEKKETVHDTEPASTLSRPITAVDAQDHEEDAVSLANAEHMMPLADLQHPRDDAAGPASARDLMPLVDQSGLVDAFRLNQLKGSYVQLSPGDRSDKTRKRLRSQLQTIVKEKTAMLNQLEEQKRFTEAVKTEAASARSELENLCLSAAFVGESLDSRKLETGCYKRFLNIQTAQDASKVLSSVRNQMSALNQLEIMINKRRLLIQVFPGVKKEDGVTNKRGIVRTGQKSAKSKKTEQTTITNTSDTTTPNKLSRGNVIIEVVPGVSDARPRSRESGQTESPVNLSTLLSLVSESYPASVQPVSDIDG